MRITLDLTELVAAGKLTREEAERLKGFAAQETGSVGINILLAFGIVAVVLGVGALVPSALTAIVLGGLLFALGMGLLLARAAAWTVLARITMTIGALLIGGGILIVFDQSQGAAFALTVGLAAAAILARSGLLAAIAVLGLSFAVGSSGGYAHALYMLAVPEPALSVGVFSAVALGLLWISTRVPPGYERVAIIGARTSVLLVNLAFLVGSLWGDARLQISAHAFTIAWAVALLVAGAWGASVNRRWVVNAAAAFGALHFYTQWFEWLGPNPLAVLGGGVLLVLFGFALFVFNQRLRKVPPTGPVSSGAAA